MPLPATIARFLALRYVDYDILPHPRTSTPLEAARVAYVPPAQLLWARALRDRRGSLVALCGADRELDLEALNRGLERDLAPLGRDQCEALFPDCPPGLVPALAGAYELKVVLEPGEPDQDIYIEVDHDTVVRMQRREIERIQSTWHVAAFSQPAGACSPAAQGDLRTRFRQRVSQLTELPAMPEMAQRIMQLRANPYADIRELARIVELDPSLAAQVVRYARSPFFGYQGEVNSTQEAISRVMGYDLTMNIILGISVVQSFNNPADGPLGRLAFWRHALYCGSMTQVLGKSLPMHLRPKPGLAYLAGMLHNFGILLLGHLFQPEFYWLNRAVEREPGTPLVELEQRVLGISHMELGTWLMEHWNLPPEVALSTREHHNPDYDGVHAVYPRLVFVANRLLFRAGLGDAGATRVSAALLQSLALSEEQVEQVLASVLDSGAGLDGIAARLAA